MKQTKRHSLLESVVNILIGYFIALGSQLVIFPLYGVHIHLKDNILIGLYFTVISLIRSFLIRRYFTKLVQ